MQRLGSFLSQGAFYHLKTQFMQKELTAEEVTYKGKLIAAIMQEAIRAAVTEGKYLDKAKVFLALALTDTDELKTICDKLKITKP